MSQIEARSRRKKIREEWMRARTIVVTRRNPRKSVTSGAANKTVKVADDDPDMDDM